MQNIHRTFLKKSRIRGFSLVEVLIVMAIIMIVSAIVWLAVGGRSKLAAKQTIIKSDMHQVILAANLYRNDNDQELPLSWKGMGYYGVNKKDKFGPGFPPADVKYDKPPQYDVSYQTPECATPSAQPMGFYLFRSMIQPFYTRPRYNQLDIEQGTAADFPYACLPTKSAVNLHLYRNGKLISYLLPARHKFLSSNLSGSIFYDYTPAWFYEVQLGN